MQIIIILTHIVNNKTTIEKQIYLKFQTTSKNSKQVMVVVVVV